MLRRDLAAAGIAETDGAGRRVDFHALRATFVTGLARSGVHPRIAQALARHSDINLTMRHYTHLVINDVAAAVEALPSLTTTEQRRSRHGGTAQASGAITGEA